MLDRLRIAALGAVVLAGACGGSSSCPNISGTWKVTQHCVSEYVGLTFPVAQSGCSFTTGDPFANFMGTVGANDEVTLSGPAGSSQPITCSGAVASGVIALNCQPSCAVSLQKQ